MTVSSQDTQIITSVAALVVSAPLTVLAILAFWRTASREELRKDDVLRWSIICIDQLRALTNTFILPTGHAERRREIAFQTSYLLDYGRLFFPNKRGLRPVILDKIMVAHRIACQTIDPEHDSWQRFAYVADQAAKDFVILAQDEVGRKKAASRYASAAGDKIDVQDMAKRVTENQLVEFRSRQVA